MRNSLVARLFLLMGLLPVLALQACAEKEMAYTLPLNEIRVIPLQVSETGYTPSLIQASLGDRLLLEVENRVARTHYLTLKNSRGEFIRSVVLPAGQPVEIPLLITEEGIWTFYGEKPLRDSPFFQGRIQVEPRP
jgi:hypothetical protein